MLDPKRQYGGGRICNTGDELIDYFRVVADRPRYKIIVRPTGDAADVAFQICADALRMETWLVVDEAHRWCSPNAGTNRHFRKVMLEGGHRGCSILAISQRLQHLTPELRSFADVVLSYRLTKKADRREMEDFIDDEEVLQKMRRFKQGELAYSFINDCPLVEQYLKEVLV